MVSSIADDVVCIYSFHFKRMVSSVFYSSVLNLRMVLSVLELKIVCGWYRSLQIVSSVFYSSLPYLRIVSSVLELITACGRCRPLQMVPLAYSFRF